MFRWFREWAWPTLVDAIENWNRDDGFQRSAGLAYYAALSLFPLCLVLIAGFGLVSHVYPPLELHQQDLIELVSENVSPWLAGQLGQLLADVKTQAGVGGPLGLAALVIAAMGIFRQLDSALDRIWGRHRPRARSWWTTIRLLLLGRLTAFIMLLALGGLLIAMVLANLALALVQRYLPGGQLGTYFWQVVHELLAPLGYALVFTIIYRVLPRASVRWREAAGGGLLAAFAWWVGQSVLESAVLYDTYNVYGVVGTFLAVMVWFYYASATVLLGAELVRSSGRDRLGDPPSARRD